MATTKRTTTKADTRTLLLEHSDGRRRKLTIPAMAKVTYGWLNPGGKGGYGDGQGGQTLRVYEGTKQTVAMQGIKSFMDLSYGLEIEKIEDEQYEELVDGRTKTRHRKVNRGFVDAMAELSDWDPDRF